MRDMNLSWKGAGRVVLALLLVSSALPLPASAQDSQAFSKPKMVSNNVRYRESGMDPATGRSGTASLTARALLGADGVAAIEMTTGSLDSSAAPPGNISKAQIKPLDQVGEAMYTQNYSGLTGGGYFSVTMGGLHHGQQVQVQTNITGIDPKRTGVVTVVETVKWRPDLALSNLGHPSTGYASTPLLVSAVVSEEKSDAGATADCVLYVDGSEVDRASGIWVDAGGVVSCSFQHIFADIGTHALEARLENIVPGDYDATNNSVSGSIEIVEPARTFHYSTSFQDVYYRHYESSNRYQSWLNGALYSDYSNTDQYDNSRFQESYLFTFTPYLIQFPINLSRGEIDDNANFVTTVMNGVNAQESGSYSERGYEFIWAGSSLFDEPTNTYVGVSATVQRDLSTGQVAAAWSQVYAFRNAGDVTYWSRGWSCYRGDYSQCEPADYYSWNYTSQYTYGRLLSPNSQVVTSLVVDSADSVRYSVLATIPLSDNSNAGNSPQRCSSNQYTDGAGNTWAWSYCDGPGSADYREKFGSVYGSGTP